MEGKAAKVHLAFVDDAIHLRIRRVFRRKNMYVPKVPYKKYQRRTEQVFFDSHMAGTGNPVASPTGVDVFHAQNCLGMPRSKFRQ